MAALDLEALAVAFEHERKGTARHGGKTAHNHMPRFEVGWVRRRAVAQEVGWRGARHDWKICDMTRDERLLRERPAANHAVDVLPDEVDGPVTHAQLHLDLRISVDEIGQPG